MDIKYRQPWRRFLSFVISGCFVTADLTTPGSTSVLNTTATLDNQIGSYKNLVKAIDCNFTIDDCYWQQSYNDTFDWLLGAGSTPSDLTGPSADHTTGTVSGRYMFIESSAPRQLADYAILSSHLLQPRNHQKMCFSFWYHMYGTNIASLSVYNERLLETHTERIQVWTASGDKGDKWLYAEVSIDPPGPLKILIKATVGTGYKGDIAIDDLALAVRPCPLKTSVAVIG